MSVSLSYANSGQIGDPLSYSGQLQYLERDLPGDIDVKEVDLAMHGNELACKTG